MKKYSKYILISVFLMTVSNVKAFAAYTSFQQMANSAIQTLQESLTPIINIASIVIGVVAVIMLIWNYIKRAKGDGQGNDALASWGFSLLFAVLALQIVKMVFV